MTSWPTTASLAIESRTVHLPLSWEDPATLDAIRRYMEVMHDDAVVSVEPRVHPPGQRPRLGRRRAPHRLRRGYLVLGLGDVYLGAPVATPLDPRHRLVTTKYNPARTWTPENTVGIGGAYLCIYGMEGPGGYQFVGRTVPVWYLDGNTPGAEPEVPWLLRSFDQLRFHPVSAGDLLDLREPAPRRAGAHHRADDVPPRRPRGVPRREHRGHRRLPHRAAGGLRRGARPLAGIGRARDRGRCSRCCRGAHLVEGRRIGQQRSRRDLRDVRRRPRRRCRTMAQRSRYQFCVASSPASSVRAASGVDAAQLARGDALGDEGLDLDIELPALVPVGGELLGRRAARRWISLMSNGKPHRARTSSRTRRWRRDGNRSRGGALALDDREGDPVHPLEDDAEDLGLRPEPVVDRRLLQPGPLGDLRHGDRLDALGGEQRPGRGHDLLARIGSSLPRGRARGRPRRRGLAAVS